MIGQAVTLAVQQALANQGNQNGEGNQNGQRNQNGNGNQNQNGQVHQLEPFVWLERFVKQKPDSFSSAPTSIDAENWIVHLEKIFDALGCDEIQKGFKDVFYEQYFSNADRGAYLREFHSIVQYHDESITDYMARFIRLAGFVGTVAGTAAQQADKFKWGLKSYLRGSIISFKFDKVVEVVDAAKDIEKERIDFSTSRSNSGSKRTMDDQGFAHDCTVSRSTGGGGAVGGSGSTVSRTLLIGRRDAYVLFDTGLTHSIASLSFVHHLGIAPSLLYPHMSIGTPMGNFVVISDVYRECPIAVGERSCKVNLLPMEMHDFDIILGMDWLSEHRATTDCQGKA
ncbi:uncharacterized protein LOC141660947 [Apium graveolens]|uniref:uncharacterized protein LOC141660947 n=1 Tax=Apium graveolens TaxID=4045 RepID=UPI003D7999B8